jgi:uncharacterized tellurite resistance protein B-like protein
MRSYPRNSPEAAARIVALALLADGHLCDREMSVLNRLDVAPQLGLSPVRLQQVVREFCEDVQQSERLHWSGADPLDEDVLQGLLADVSHPAQRLVVLRLCARIVEADGRITEGESRVIDVACAHWGVLREALAPEPETWLRAA